MPCSHLPRHGGPYSPAWNRPALTVPAPNGNTAGEISDVGLLTDSGERDALQDEIARLRDELKQAQRQNKYAGSASQNMVWLTLALFALAAMFACYTIVTHG